MTDNHLAACLRLANSCYTPDYEKHTHSSARSPGVLGGNFIFINSEIHLFCIWFIWFVSRPVLIKHIGACVFERGRVCDVACEV